METGSHRKASRTMGNWMAGVGFAGILVVIGLSAYLVSEQHENENRLEVLEVQMEQTLVDLAVIIALLTPPSPPPILRSAEVKDGLDVSKRDACPDNTIPYTDHDGNEVCLASNTLVTFDNEGDSFFFGNISEDGPVTLATFLKWIQKIYFFDSLETYICDDWEPSFVYADILVDEAGIYAHDTSYQCGAFDFYFGRRSPASLGSASVSGSAKAGAGRNKYLLEKVKQAAAFEDMVTSMYGPNHDGSGNIKQAVACTGDPPSVQQQTSVESVSN